MPIDVKFQDGRKERYDSFKKIICLDNYNNNIISISCYDNQLTELPTLPDSLKYLNCNNNQLTELPTLPDSLTQLYCYKNQLTNLPTLPDSLKELYCSNNQLTELPSLPDSLIKLCCWNNKLTELPTLPDNLKKILCSDNKLTELPDLPDSLKITFNNNPIYDFIQNHFDGNVIIYQENKLVVQKISDWFLECKGNPKYAYCRRVVNQGYDDLNNSV